MYDNEWKTGEGHTLKIVDMDTPHLNNTIAYLERKMGSESAYKMVQYRNMMAEKAKRTRQSLRDHEGSRRSKSGTTKPKDKVKIHVGPHIMDRDKHLAAMGKDIERAKLSKAVDDALKSEAPVIRGIIEKERETKGRQSIISKKDRKEVERQAKKRTKENERELKRIRKINRTEVIKDKTKKVKAHATTTVRWARAIGFGVFTSAVYSIIKYVIIGTL